LVGRFENNLEVVGVGGGVEVEKFPEREVLTYALSSNSIQAILYSVDW
jgi:hypothetical protein